MICRAHAGQDHEVLRAFEAQHEPLNAALSSMLDEHHSHRTERRGCGFTQASRHLAEYINNLFLQENYEFARLFENRSRGVVPRLRARAAELGADFRWRKLDRDETPRTLLADPEFRQLFDVELERQQRLLRLPDSLQFEESVLIARMIRDILIPANATELGIPELPLYDRPLSIGTCTLAEKYFLELAQGLVRRCGRVNVICSRNRPLLLEKLHLGDNHSCISVTPLLLNGVELPAGSLIGVHYGGLRGASPNRELPGILIPLEACHGFRFLRVTTLAVSPKNRARAFTKHFEAQLRGDLFAPDSVEIAQLTRLARRQLREEPARQLTA